MASYLIIIHAYIYTHSYIRSLIIIRDVYITTTNINGQKGDVLFTRKKTHNKRGIATVALLSLLLKMFEFFFCFLSLKFIHIFICFLIARSKNKSMFIIIISTTRALNMYSYMVFFMFNFFLCLLPLLKLEEVSDTAANAAAKAALLSFLQPVSFF